MRIWNIVKDEVLLIVGLVASWGFVKITIIQQENYFWVSLLITVGFAGYFTYRFFKKQSGIGVFWHFLVMLCATIIYFAFMYIIFGLKGLPEAQGMVPNLQQALYFSVVTWTTLGYGDLTPTEDSMPWAMLEVILGYIFMALLVGKVFAIFRQMETDQDTGS